MSAETHIDIAHGSPLRAGTPGRLDGASRGTRFSRQQPKHLSFRYALESDLGRISYVIPVSRWVNLPELSSRAKRVLNYFVSWGRIEPAGYRGTQCSQGALAAAIVRATGEPCSVKTLQRALSELIEHGFLSKSYVDREKVRHNRAHIFKREQICLYTLTDKAVAIWTAQNTPSTYTCIPATKSRRDLLPKPELKIQSSARVNEHDIGDTKVKAVPPEIKKERTELAGGFQSTLKLADEKASSPPQQCLLPIPHVATEKQDRHKNTKLAILETLSLLLKHKGREGKIAIARATHEISGVLSTLKK